MSEKRKNIKQEEVFKVPENYFEDFTENMMQKVVAARTRKRIRILSLAKPHLMLAASMIFLVVLSYTTLRLILPEIYNRPVVDNKVEIAEYLVSEIDEATIMESIDLSGYENSSDDEIDTSLTEDEIIDYLANENINYEEIFNDL